MLGGSDILKAILKWLQREPAAGEQWCAMVKGPCWQHRCVHYMHVIGKHPQSGKDVDNYDCAFKWLPILTIENTQQTIHLAAAIESERNELIKEGVRNRATLASAALLVGGSDQAKLINGASDAANGDS
jgi:hypothetical protein